MQRFAHAAQIVLHAISMRHAGGDGLWPINRANRIKHADAARILRQRITAGRAVLGFHQTLACQPLQHFGHQMRRNPVLAGNVRGAAFAMAVVHGKMAERNEPIIRFF